MIYIVYKADQRFSLDLPPVKELIMELDSDVSGDEAIEAFTDFLRGAGYVIPYGFEQDDIPMSVKDDGTNEAKV